MRWLVVFGAAASLVAAAGACGSSITVPDQGVIVSGCQFPAACYLPSCSCSRASLNADYDPNMAPNACRVPAVCSNPADLTTCNCPAGDMSLSVGGMLVETQCLEPAQVCVGRGVLCSGPGARCAPAGGGCAGSDPPMLVPVSGPSLEPHCQFTDDVCVTCADAGVTD